MKLQHCLEIGAITFPRGNVEDVFPEVEGDKLAARKGNTEELGEPGHKEPVADTDSLRKWVTTTQDKGCTTRPSSLRWL